MKCFALIPTSFTYGVLYDDGKVTTALFLTPGEAKFQASFRSIGSSLSVPFGGDGQSEAHTAR